MKTIRKKMSTVLSRLLVVAMVLQTMSLPAHAVAKSIPVDIDLTNVLVKKSAQVDAANTFLVNWRSGPITNPVTTMSFAALTGTNRSYPSRATVQDHTANNQGDLWSDNAIQFVGTNPNQLSVPGQNPAVQAVLIYTDNEDAGNCNTATADPLCGVTLRGGLIGGFGGPADNTNPYRVSELPLLWKAVASADLISAQGANPASSQLVVSTSPLYMASELITAPANCPTGTAEGPYQSGALRPTAGFCDFSTHYFIDKSNNVHANTATSIQLNSWYTAYPIGGAGSNYDNAFNYATLVGPFGANSTENGKGVLPLEPLASNQSSTIANAQRAYFLLGMSARSALLTHYGTTINIDLLSE